MKLACALIFLLHVQFSFLPSVALELDYVRSLDRQTTQASAQQPQTRVVSPVRKGKTAFLGGDILYGIESSRAYLMSFLSDSTLEPSTILPLDPWEAVITSPITPWPPSAMTLSSTVHSNSSSSAALHSSSSYQI